MITCITYGDRKFQGAARLNLETAKLHGADTTILYTPKDLPLSYKIKNWRLYYRIVIPKIRPRWRGAGYWIWKSYIIKKTLEEINEGDYLIYSDGGSVYVNEIKPLLDCFEKEKLDFMVFSILHLEKHYSKRDAFILLDADEPMYTDTPQHPSGYLVFKKCDRTMKFVKEWHKASLDPRIVSDSKNVLGRENYEGFVANRHDQTALSIIAKKYGIKNYRDPSQFGNRTEDWTRDVIERSDYPQIWYSTRDKDIDSIEKFMEKVPNPYGIE